MPRNARHRPDGHVVRCTDAESSGGPGGPTTPCEGGLGRVPAVICAGQQGRTWRARIRKPDGWWIVILRLMRATSHRASSCTMSGCAASCFRTLRGQHARISVRSVHASRFRARHLLLCMAGTDASCRACASLCRGRRPFPCVSGACTSCRACAERQRQMPKGPQCLNTPMCNTKLCPGGLPS